MRIKRTRIDCCRVLGISRKAGERESKRAYRRLAKLHHPDGRGGDFSEEFLEIQEAYEVLSDPERRRRYHRFGDPDYDEELISRLQQMAGPASHPFFRFAIRCHYRRMLEIGCRSARRWRPAPPGRSGCRSSTAPGKILKRLNRLQVSLKSF